MLDQLFSFVLLNIALLNIALPNERYTPEKVRAMYGRSEVDLKFPVPIPVNITYQTAFVDDAGTPAVPQASGRQRAIHWASVSMQRV